VLYVLQNAPWIFTLCNVTSKIHWEFLTAGCSIQVYFNHWFQMCLSGSCPLASFFKMGNTLGWEHYQNGVRLWTCLSSPNASPYSGNALILGPYHALICVLVLCIYPKHCCFLQFCATAILSGCVSSVVSHQQCVSHVTGVSGFSVVSLI
jgi:hypothetical protein